MVDTASPTAPWLVALRAPFASESRTKTLLVALFAAWGLAAVVVGLERPGRLLDIALLGAAGALIADVLVRARLGIAGTTLALGGAAAILVNTWPVEIWDLAADRLPAFPLVAGNPPVLVLAVALPLAVRGARVRPPLLLACGAGSLVVGGLLAALVSAHVEAALSALVLGLVAPVTFGLLAASTPIGVGQAWHVVEVWLAAAVVPLALSVAAFVVEFGVPSGGGELFVVKRDLYRPHLIQDISFGNVGHLADYALMIAPLAVVGAVRAEARRSSRIVAGGVLLGAVLCLVAVLERAPLVLSAVALAALGGVFVARGARWAAAVPWLASLAIVAVVGLSPPVRSYVTFLRGDNAYRVATTSTAPAATTTAPVATTTAPAATTTAQGGTTTAPSAMPGPAGAQPVPPPEDSQSSASMRADAISTAFGVFADHAPLGVGPGEYIHYDPVHQAAHSLPVQLLAEDGVLALGGFVLLVVWVVLEAVRWLREQRRSSSALLRLGLIAAAATFLVEGTLTGTQLAAGRLNLWGVLLFLMLGLLAALAGPRRGRRAAG